MILFKARFIAPVLDGRKTQTRRLRKNAIVRPGGMYEARTYRAGKTFARIHVHEVRKERLGEGYSTPAEFLKDFFAIHDGTFRAGNPSPRPSRSTSSVTTSGGIPK